MNHVKNIKDMLNISAGNRNVATNGYSSLTDSQMFFGSQFWPENSQSASQDWSVSSRNSQQSSQEGSDSKFVNSYHTKPLIFGDYKDKTKSSGLLEKFEQDKEKAKEKNDSDFLAKESRYIRDTLNNIKQLVISAEANTTVCQTVFEKMDNIASTLENNVKLLQNDISQKLETLVDEVNYQKQVMTKLEDKVQKNGETTAECDSHLQSLKNSLQCLREEQDRERHILEEALKLLNTIVSERLAKINTEGMMDSAIQTSPSLEQFASSTLLDGQDVGNKLTRTANACENHQAKAFPQDHKDVLGRRTFTPRKKSKKRPLVLPQRTKCTVSDENRQPANSYNKQEARLKPLRKQCSQKKLPNKLSSRRFGETAGCFISPVCYWSPDSSSPECLTAIEPILEKLAGVSKLGSPAKPGSLWQLFDSD